jgi:putative addiction module antidote
MMTMATVEQYGGLCYTLCITSQGQAVNEKPRTIEIEGYLLQVKRIGNSVGLILPKELLARLKLREGDKLHVIEQPERGFKLTPYDPKHAKAMEIARRSFRKYADTYKALAK